MGATEPDFVTRKASPRLGRSVARLSGYKADTTPSVFLEASELVFPLILNFGARWTIGLGSKPAIRPKSSFTAGLFAGPVHISSGPGAHLLQVDLTPLGAARLFGPAAAELAGRVVDLDDLAPLSAHLPEMTDRLEAAPDWGERFGLVERMLAPLFVHDTSRRVHMAWSCLAKGHSIGETARYLGCSTRTLSGVFRRETGVRPVTAARMLRFARLNDMLQGVSAPSWADLAAASGYADQSHLVREVQRLAGKTPTVWMRDVGPEARSVS